MKKAEKLANLAKSQKTTLFNRIFYFFLIRKLTRSAKKHYGGYIIYDTSCLNPYIRERLEKDEFKVRDKKDKKGMECTSIEWICKKNIEEHFETDGEDTTVD